MRAFNLVHKEIKESGISRAALADRLGLGQDRVSKLLGAPGNWTLDTISDVIFAARGALVDYSLLNALDRPPRNDTRPAYLNIDLTAGATKPSVNRTRGPISKLIFQKEAVDA